MHTSIIIFLCSAVECFRPCAVHNLFLRGGDNLQQNLLGNLNTKLVPTVKKKLILDWLQREMVEERHEPQL